MVDTPISGMTVVAYKSSLLIPAIDPTAPPGLKNIAIPITAIVGSGGGGGTTIWSGSTVPENTFGNNGDYFLLNLNGVITLLGPKSGGSWPGAGAALTVGWFFGEGAPESITGAVANSIYQDTVTGNIWQFENDEWGLVFEGIATALEEASAALNVPWQPFPGAVNGVITLPFPAAGNAAFSGTISANTVFAITGGGTTNLQKMRVAIIEDATGGWTIGLPGKPAVRWPGAPGGGATPAPSTVASARNVFEFLTTTTANAYDGSY